MANAVIFNPRQDEAGDDQARQDKAEQAGEQALPVAAGDEVEAGQRDGQRVAAG